MYVSTCTYCMYVPQRTVTLLQPFVDTNKIRNPCTNTSEISIYISKKDLPTMTQKGILPEETSSEALICAPFYVQKIYFIRSTY